MAAKEKDVVWRLDRMVKRGRELERTMRKLEADMRDKSARMVDTLSEFSRNAQECQQMYNEVMAAQREERDKEIAELRLQVQGQEVIIKNDPQKAKAATIAIFDSILFGIENWSTDGDTAPDFVLGCQAVLFPLVYEQVMSGNEDYQLKRVPFAALEVVRRGREYVKYLRTTYSAALTDSAVWSLNIGPISEWWRNDALPLLYGARDDAWDASSTLSLEAIMIWRDQPASRALQFPQVFDAMDLVDRFGDSIRDTTGLPEFTRQTIDTRLEVN